VLAAKLKIDKAVVVHTPVEFRTTPACDTLHVLWFSPD